MDKLFDLVVLEHDFNALETYEDVVVEGITETQADNYVHLNASKIRSNIRLSSDHDVLLVPEGDVNKAYERSWASLSQEEQGDYHAGLCGLPTLDPDELDVHKAYNLDRIIKKMAMAKELYG